MVDGYRPRDDLSYILYNTLGGQVGRFALRGDRTMFLFIFRAEHDSAGAAPKINQLRTQFGNAGWECRNILATLDDVDDLYFDVVSQVRMDRWSRGRVLLIGDAAGCISLLGGEGTGLAIAEAYVLAWELARPAPTTAAPSMPTRRACVPSSRASKPVRRETSGFSPPGPDSACGSATWRCGMMKFGPLARLFAGSVRDDFQLPDYGI